jgi:signal peptidase II
MAQKINPKNLIWLLLSFAVLLLDQLSKWAITETVLRPQYGAMGSSFLDWYKVTPDILPYTSIPVTSFFNLVMVWNTGVSFGMMGNHGAYGPIILIAMATAITLFFTLWMLRTADKGHKFCFALIIGGAAGNIIDRARFGAVIDFLDFHAFGYHYPAFNVADMAVVIGVILLIILSIVFDILRKDGYSDRISKASDAEKK